MFFRDNLDSLSSLLNIDQHKSNEMFSNDKSTSSISTAHTKFKDTEFQLSIIPDYGELMDDLFIVKTYTFYYRLILYLFYCTSYFLRHISWFHVLVEKPTLWPFYSGPQKILRPCVSCKKIYLNIMGNNFIDYTSGVILTSERKTLCSYRCEYRKTEGTGWKSNLQILRIHTNPTNFQVN